MRSKQVLIEAIVTAVLKSLQHSNERRIEIAIGLGGMKSFKIRHP